MKILVASSLPGSCTRLSTRCLSSCGLRSRKTLIYLILTLNHCYPDYDFSLLRAHHFRKEPGVAAVEEAVDSHLLEVSKVLAACFPISLLVWYPPQTLCCNEPNHDAFKRSEQRWKSNPVGRLWWVPGSGCSVRQVDGKLLPALLCNQKIRVGALQVWENTPGCGESAFLDTMWTAIDEAVALQECEVYSYKSDGETDPFGESSLAQQHALQLLLLPQQFFGAQARRRHDVHDPDHHMWRFGPSMLNRAVSAAWCAEQCAACMT